MIRKPIITVLGHVDAGKTKFLDSVRGTTIAEKEAGNITQHIGATEVPIEVIRKLAGGLLEKFGFEVTVPGLLFIDTPGHEAFANLRKRGGSIADLSILMVDVQKGCQNQTYEALEILKNYKTPFIVVASKVDTLQGWEGTGISMMDSLQRQEKEVLSRLDEKIYAIVGQLHEKGFTTDRFDRVSDFTQQIPIIPVNSKKQEGIPEVLMFLAGLSQKYLEKKLRIHVAGSGKGTILEVKEERGLGKTIDVILYDGTLKVGEEIALGGTQGVITTKVRALLEPKSLNDMRHPHEKFSSIREIHAAAGVKIAAPGLEKALPGSPMRVADHPTAEQEIREEIQSITIESAQMGVTVKADSLGALEAIIQLLKERNIPIRRADVGEVSRKDIMEVATVSEKDRYLGVLFAFSTKVIPEAEGEAEKRKVRIFASHVIYEIIEQYEQWKKEEQDLERKEGFNRLVMPAKIRVLPGSVFRNSGPAIFGVRIEEGRLKNGITLSKKGTEVGKVNAIQSEGKNLEEGKRGEDVAISVSDAIVGKNVHENDVLHSHLPSTQWEAYEQYKDLFSSEERELIEEIKNMQKKTKKEEGD